MPKTTRSPIPLTNIYYESAIVKCMSSSNHVICLLHFSDPERPICGQCEASRSVCKYSESNKRGIPTGYLGLLEQRLNETEKVLYKTLSELAARDGLKAREWTPREAGMSKHERMKEWKEYPLNGEGCIERWRGLFGGSDVPDNGKIINPKPSRTMENLYMNKLKKKSNSRWI